MKQNQTGKLWSGVMFIILGFIFLLQELFPRLDFEDFWPVLLIITGVIIIYDGLKKPDMKNESEDYLTQKTNNPKKELENGKQQN